MFSSGDRVQINNPYRSADVMQRGIDDGETGVVQGRVPEDSFEEKRYYVMTDNGRIGEFTEGELVKVATQDVNRDLYQQPVMDHAPLYEDNFDFLSNENATRTFNHWGSPGEMDILIVNLEGVHSVWFTDQYSEPNMLIKRTRDPEEARQAAEEASKPYNSSIYKQEIPDWTDPGEKQRIMMAKQAVSVGDRVSWGEGRNGSTGTVKQVKSDGALEGLKGDAHIVGSEDEPVAKIQLDDEDEFVGHNVSSLEVLSWFRSGESDAS